MKQKLMTLDELFNTPEEADRVDRIRADIAREKIAWDALTPEEQAAQIVALEAKYPDVPDVDPDDEKTPCAGCGEPDCDFDCDGDADDYLDDGEDD
jgi:hypothetical protein